MRFHLSVWTVLVMGWASADSTSAQVRTTSGMVEGIKHGHVQEFLGIPYAEPPTGALRWQAPRLFRSNRRLRADMPGAPCAQNSTSLFARSSNDEDCLYLNIFTPADDSGVARTLPVMVWFHGGGLFSGSGNDYDGGFLAGTGRVIVVTVNYRLGALGFLDDPVLNAASAGAANYGLLDQQLALRWVRENIGAFGGDRGRVTIAGQSSGATSVVAQLISPAARGLFHRAIIQSGVRLIPLPGEQARALSAAFIDAVGCTDDRIACLRSLSVQAILDRQRDLVMSAATHFFVIDGVTLSRGPLEAIAAGDYARVPIINGLTADEQAYFIPELSSGIPLSTAQYEAWARTVGGSRYREVLDRYPPGHFASPSLAEIAAAQDAKHCVSMRLDRELSRRSPVFAYLFADRDAPSYFPSTSYVMGAYHTAELQYLFPLFHGARGTPHELTAPQAALAGSLRDLWAGFISAGRPRSPHGPAWAPFNALLRNEMVFSGPERSAMRNNRGFPPARDDSAICAFWDPLNDSP